MDDTKEQTLSSESSQTPAGSDTTPVSTTAKSKNADKNEAKRQAKLAKYAAKQAKLTHLTEGEKKKEKEKKPKSDKASRKVDEFIDNTPPGEKKGIIIVILEWITREINYLSESMASTYNPKAVEAAWYAWWENQGSNDPGASWIFVESEGIVVEVTSDTPYDQLDITVEKIKKKPKKREERTVITDS